MNPARVVRSKVVTLTDLPNVGEATAGDLRLLGIEHPRDLQGRDPYEMFEQLCAITRSNQDPCVIDVFLSVTDFMSGGEPKPWWSFTAERKTALRRSTEAL
jgi:hypothetical protein